jgi:hypothetical protein
MWRINTAAAVVATDADACAVYCLQCCCSCRTLPCSFCVVVTSVAVVVVVLSVVVHHSLSEAAELSSVCTDPRLSFAAAAAAAASAAVGLRRTFPDKVGSLLSEEPGADAAADGLFLAAGVNLSVVGADGAAKTNLPFFFAGDDSGSSRGDEGAFLLPDPSAGDRRPSPLNVVGDADSFRCCCC